MMKKTFMALALTLLPFGMASAQVRMLVVPKDGTAPKSFNLDDIRRIDFLGEANTFSIACATDRWSYEFDKVRCLKFDGLVNDIATATKKESDITISYKEGRIFVSGMGDAVTHAVIFDLNGCSRLSLPHYDGQPIDVSALPKGAYILRLGDKAFKFLR